MNVIKNYNVNTNMTIIIANTLYTVNDIIIMLYLLE